MRVLDRKLVRDLRRLWAQSLAIALVMACGVATLILSVGTFRSLDETRTAYYERYRFGDVFASAVRAPASLASSFASINGVAAVETRIMSPVMLDIEGLREPASGLAISIPANHEMSVNALFMREGRLPEPARANEIVLSANFADAHGFQIGSTFEVIANGTKMTVLAVGIAMSPEYVYALGPGSLMPDNRRFGVLWMPEASLASRFDLDGAFNSVSLRLLRNGNEKAVIEELDALLKPYGGTGAIGRKDQTSHAFLDSELTQLQGMAKSIPPIFLLVSAFLINLILSRLIALEREQIGLLKALGYGRFEVAWHYLKLVLVIAMIGVAIGAGLGTWAGRGLTVIYSQFYSFPFLLFQSTPDIYLLAGSVSLIAAALGALRAISTAFALPAAVAMRPPSPVTYRQFFTGFLERFGLFSQLAIMGIRHVVRYPVRSGLTSLGVAFSVALPSVGMGTIDSMEAMIDAVYFQADRQDATLAFAADRPLGAVANVRHLPGVMRVEPYLAVPARLSNGHYSRQLAITGKPAQTDLSRVLDLDLQPVRLPQTGLALGDRVADLLDVRVGDLVRVEILSGKRWTSEVPVTQIIKAYIGLNVFMDIKALSRLAGSGNSLSGAHIDIDPNQLDALYAVVKDTPLISAVTLQTVARQLFRETMRENIAVMMGVYIVLSVIIAFGVVYNSARIQLSERARELATLRVLGFRRVEVSNVLFIEIGLIVAFAQPLGWLIGTGFGKVITQGLATDLFRIPFVMELDTYALSSVVVIAAALGSALIVRRRIDKLDLIQVLKTRE